MKLFCTSKHEISTTQKAWEYGKSQNGLCSLKTEWQSKFCLETIFVSITLIWTDVTMFQIISGFLISILIFHFQMILFFHQRHNRKKTVLMKHDVCTKSLMMFLQGKPWSQFHKLDLINDVLKSFSFSFFIFPRRLSLKTPFLSK